MLFVIVKKLHPDTRAECSDIKPKLKNMKRFHFKNEIPKPNLHIVEWINKIYIAGENYS